MNPSPPGNTKARGSMKPSMTRLQNIHTFMVRAVSERPDGKSFVPIVLYLEQQIAAADNAETEYERIIRLAQQSAA